VIDAGSYGAGVRSSDESWGRRSAVGEKKGDVLERERKVWRKCDNSRSKQYNKSKGSWTWRKAKYPGRGKSKEEGALGRKKVGGTGGPGGGIIQIKRKGAGEGVKRGSVGINGLLTERKLKENTFKKGGREGVAVTKKAPHFKGESIKLDTGASAERKSCGQVGCGEWEGLSQKQRIRIKEKTQKRNPKQQRFRNTRKGAVRVEKRG